MKIFQKTIASAATLALVLVSLAAPITTFAATTSKTVKATPTATVIATPTEAPTVAPVEATPMPAASPSWIMTHKKISLGVLVVVVLIGYFVFRPGKKGNGSPPEEQSKPEEPKAEEQSKPEDQTPPESTV